MTAIGCAVALLTTAFAAMAGTMFRLEIGPPVAGGTTTKLKNAVLVVRPVLCEPVTAVRITGTAEGSVHGARQSIPLRLTPLPTPGVYAVQRQWPADGQWVLHLAGSCPSSKAAASTIVPLANGRFIREQTQVLREPATTAQVDAALTALVRGPS
jgi:hypothetical protein